MPSTRRADTLLRLPQQLLLPRRRDATASLDAPGTGCLFTRRQWAGLGRPSGRRLLDSRKDTPPGCRHAPSVDGRSEKGGGANWRAGGVLEQRELGRCYSAAQRKSALGVGGGVCSTCMRDDDDVTRKRTLVAWVCRPLSCTPSLLFILMYKQPLILVSNINLT